MRLRNETGYGQAWKDDFLYSVLDVWAFLSCSRKFAAIFTLGPTVVPMYIAYLVGTGIRWRYRRPMFLSHMSKAALARMITYTVSTYKCIVS